MVSTRGGEVLRGRHLGYDPGIAQLRFLAAFAVALYHLWTLQLVALPLFRPGWLGVPLFFELSIYLLLNRLDARPSLRHYFVRRVRRIWPLYFPAVVVVYLADVYILHMDVTVYALALHFVFLSFVLAPFSMNYLFWSLQLEEWMYLAIPIIHRLSDKKKLWVATALITTSLLYSLYTTLQPYNVFHYLYFMPPYWLGAYGWGTMAYVMRKRGASIPRRPVYAALALLYTVYVTAAVLVKNEVIYEFTVRFVIYNAALIAFAALILNPPRPLHKTTVFLGEVSYGMYLWTLLLQELYGAAGTALGILAAAATEYPLRAREINTRLKTTR